MHGTAWHGIVNFRYWTCSNFPVLQVFYIHTTYNKFMLILHTMQNAQNILYNLVYLPLCKTYQRLTLTTRPWPNIPVPLESTPT